MLFNITQEDLDWEENIIKNENNTILHSMFCKHTEEDITRMKELLLRDPESLDRREHRSFDDINEVPQTPSLSHAAKLRHHDCVMFLLKAGARAIEDTYFKNILEVCICSGSVDAVKYILEREKIPVEYVKSDDGSSGLTSKNYYINMSLIYNPNNYEMIELLTNLGAPIDDFNNSDNFTLKIQPITTPSMNAIASRLPKTLQLLLINGAVIDHRQLNLTDLTPEMKDSMSLIHHFIMSTDSLLPKYEKLEEEKKILNLLYQFGADLSQENRLGMTPLQVLENKVVWLNERDMERNDPRRESCTVEDLNETDAYKELVAYYKELMSQPLSLTSLNRISLVRELKTNYRYMQSVNSLPPNVLPREMLAFLNFNDLPAN